MKNLVDRYSGLTGHTAHRRDGLGVALLMDAQELLQVLDLGRECFDASLTYLVRRQRGFLGPGPGGPTRLGGEAAQFGVAQLGLKRRDGARQYRHRAACDDMRLLTMRGLWEVTGFDARSIGPVAHFTW